MDIENLISNVAFPIAVAVLLLTRFEKKQVDIENSIDDPERGVIVKLDKIMTKLDSILRKLSRKK